MRFERATDHAAIRHDGLVWIGGRLVRPSVQPRRKAIRAVFMSEAPATRRFKPADADLERRRAGRRWSTYRFVRSGVHAAWCRVTCEINGWEGA